MSINTNYHQYQVSEWGDELMKTPQARENEISLLKKFPRDWVVMFLDSYLI